MHHLIHKYHLLVFFRIPVLYFKQGKEFLISSRTAKSGCYTFAFGLAFFIFYLFCRLYGFVSHTDIFINIFNRSSCKICKSEVLYIELGLHYYRVIEHLAYNKPVFCKSPCRSHIQSAPFYKSVRVNIINSSICPHEGFLVSSFCVP